MGYSGKGSREEDETGGFGEEGGGSTMKGTEREDGEGRGRTEMERDTGA